MKKRLLGALCAAVLTLTLLISAASAADELYFLSLNDTLSPLAADLMPIRTTSAIYIPSGVFNRNLTGVNLGVYFGQDKTMGTATLYSKDRTLIFDINGGYACDSPEGRIYPYRAIIRNGRTYLPAYSVCQFFGLDYSALSTDYGPLIRIKVKENYSLTDTVFISSAAAWMSSRLNEYLQSQAGPSASPSVPPSASTQPTDGNKSSVKVYLAVRVDSGQDLESLLDILDARSVPALFFFRPSDLAAYDGLIRRMAGSGHQIGLLIKGETAQELTEQVTQGNLLLEHILRQRTYTVLVDGTDSQRTQMSERGFLCWLENVNGRNEGRSVSALVGDIMNDVAAKRSFARIILEDGIAPTAFSRLIGQLKSDRYDIRAAVETTFLR